MSRTEHTLAKIKGFFQASPAPFNSREEKLLDQLLVRLSCTLDPAALGQPMQQYLDTVPYLPLARKAQLLPSLLGLVEQVSKQGQDPIRETRQKDRLRTELRTEFAGLLHFRPLDLALSSSHQQRLVFCLEFLEASIEEAETIFGRDKGIIPQCKEDLDTLHRRIQTSEESLDSQSLQEVFRIKLRASFKKLYDWLHARMGYEKTKQIFDQVYQPMASYYCTFAEFAFLVDLLPPRLLDPNQLMLLRRDS